MPSRDGTGHYEPHDPACLAPPCCVKSGLERHAPPRLACLDPRSLAHLATSRLPSHATCLTRRTEPWHACQAGPRPTYPVPPATSDHSATCSRDAWTGLTAPAQPRLVTNRRAIPGLPCHAPTCSERLALPNLPCPAQSPVTRPDLVALPASRCLPGHQRPRHNAPAMPRPTKQRLPGCAPWDRACQVPPWAAMPGSPSLPTPNHRDLAIPRLPCLTLPRRSWPCHG